MALNVAQVAALEQLLFAIPALVDRLEQRRADFSTAVLSWLRQVESTLEMHRLPAVSQVASVRGALLQAGRGQIADAARFVGRPTPRKLMDAAAQEAVQRVNALLEEQIRARQQVFSEAGHLANQLVAIADAKGLNRRNGGVTHEQFLRQLEQTMRADTDLAGGMVHLTGLVGRTDVLIFLDRALPMP